MNFSIADGATPGDDVSFRDAFGARAFVTYESGAYCNETTLSFYGIDRDSVGTNGFGDSSFSARGKRYQISNITSFSATQTIDRSIGIDYLTERSVAGGLPAAGECTSTTGGFIETVYAPTDRTDIIATAKIDSHSAFGEFLTERLAFAHRPTGQTTYRGAIATGYRAPSIRKLFADFCSFTGNPDLTPKTSVTAELGIDRALAGGGRVSATVFWGQIDNLIQTTSNFSMVENIAGASISQGIEPSGEMPIKGGASIYGAATFMEARSADGKPLARVSTTDIVLGGTLDISDRTTLNSNARYAAGLKTCSTRSIGL